jgi:hypothetical protein
LVAVVAEKKEWSLCCWIVRARVVEVEVQMK